MPQSIRSARAGTRRLTSRDVPEALALYRAAGRDGAWADEDSLARACTAGQLYGVFSGGLHLCGGVYRAPLFPDLRAAVDKTLLVPRGCRLLLPPAGTSVRGAESFLELLLARAAGERPVWLPVPVRTGTPLLRACFGAGFTLRAIRPLHRLRPHYFFESCGGEVKMLPEYSIMIPVSDTLTLSRLLENGMRGVGLRAARGGPAVCLAEDETKAGIG